MISNKRRINHSQWLRPCTVLAFLFFSSSYLLAQGNQKETLFDPSKPGDWYTYIERQGVSNDSFHVFTFEKGKTIHVSGQHFGYIITRNSYQDFHLTVEFKWGERRWPPRDTVKRDAGILYNIPEGTKDHVWPKGIEFQVQQGDCGDFWMVDSTTISHADSVTTPADYRRAQKFKDAERPKGEWNIAEVVIKNGEITHIMNGVVVNKGSHPSSKEGKILLQSEGAEIFYRNITIIKL